MLNVTACVSRLVTDLGGMYVHAQLLDHLEVDINEAKKAELFARFDPDNSKVITYVEFEAAYSHLQVCARVCMCLCVCVYPSVRACTCICCREKKMGGGEKCRHDCSAVVFGAQSLVLGQEKSGR